MSVVRWPGSRDRATDSSGYRSDHWRRIWNVSQRGGISCATKSHASAHVKSENSGGGTSRFMMRVHFRVLQCGMKANSIKSQDIVSFSGARGLRVSRSCLLACCSHSRLLSSSNSASQILSRLVTFASATYGFHPEITMQRNFDDVPSSKPRAHWLGCYAFIVASSSFAFQLR